MGRKITAVILSLCFILSGPVSAVAGAFAAGGQPAGGRDHRIVLECPTDRGTVSVEGELPGGTALSVSEMDEADNTGLAVYDIKLTSETGETLQPGPDCPVTVRIGGLEPTEGADIFVMHILDCEEAILEGLSDGSVRRVTDPDLVERYSGSAAVLETDREGECIYVEMLSTADGSVVVGADGALEFETRSFSIYVIDDKPVLIVRFYNTVSYSESDPVATMYVMYEDEVDEVVYDPGTGVLKEDEGFFGWSTDKDFSLDDYGSGLTIEDVRALVKSELASLDGKKELSLYAMVFEVCRIAFWDENDVIMKSAVIPKGMSYDDVPGYYPYNEDLHFEGWITGDAGSIENYEGIVKPIQPGTELTILGDVNFYADTQKGNWLVFKENGKNARFTPAQFIKEGTTTADPYGEGSGPTRLGYIFDGWFPETDEDGNPTFTTDEDGNAQPNQDLLDEEGKLKSDARYQFGNTISQKVTLYAHWIPQDPANYTVVIWKQSIDDPDEYDFEEAILASGSTKNPLYCHLKKDYDSEDAEDYYYLSLGTADAGTDDILDETAAEGTGRTVSLDDNNTFGAEDNRNRCFFMNPKDDAILKYIGFKLMRIQSSDLHENGSITVRPEGTTVINVYYDRIVYNLRFYYAALNSSNNWGLVIGQLGGSYETAPTLTNAGFFKTSIGNITLGNFPNGPIDPVGYSKKYGKEFSLGVPEVEDGVSYYYFVITARYGESIDDRWPEYSVFRNGGGQYKGTDPSVPNGITCLGNAYMISWFLMAGAGDNTSQSSSPGNGTNTVKGVVSEMNEKILGRLWDSDGNYLIARYAKDIYNIYRYHILREYPEGITPPSGKEPIAYPSESNPNPFGGDQKVYYYPPGTEPGNVQLNTVGNGSTDSNAVATDSESNPLAENGSTSMTFYEDIVLDVRANSYTSGIHQPDYKGFHIQTDGPSYFWVVTECINPSVTALNTRKYIYDVYMYYPRDYVTITYTDGSYFDGNGNRLDDNSAFSDKPYWAESRAIPYQMDIAQYGYTEQSDGSLSEGQKFYKPLDDLWPGYIDDGSVDKAQREKRSKEIDDEYVFGGWYLDSTCQQPVVFKSISGDKLVYAKWIQKQYRVFLHPGADPDKEPEFAANGMPGQNTSFRVDWGKSVSRMNAVRTDYRLIDWFTDPEFSNAFPFETTELNDETVPTPYDRTHTTETDPYGLPIDEDQSSPDWNKDVTRDRFWINRQLDLYARWRQILYGANGINVEYVYDTDELFLEDPLMYLDETDAVANTAPPSDNLRFKYWIIMKWNDTEYEETGDYVYPGDVFTVRKDLCRTEPVTGDPLITVKYTMRLKAVYGTTLATAVVFDANGGKLGSSAQSEWNPVLIHAQLPPEGENWSVPTRTGFIFRGWAFSADAEKPDIDYENNAYAADNHDGDGWNEDEKKNYLYAVWEPDPNIDTGYHSYTVLLVALQYLCLVTCAAAVAMKKRKESR